MYAQYLSILGPFQQEQRRIQTSPDEISQVMNNVKSPKEIIEFYKLFLTSLQFACPENLKIENVSNLQDVFNDENKLNDFIVHKKKNGENVTIHKWYFLFLHKYKILINYFDYKLWDWDFLFQQHTENVFSTQIMQDFIEMKNNFLNCEEKKCDIETCVCKLQTKEYFLQCLENEIHSLFQFCLDVCKFETQEIFDCNDMKKLLLEELNKYVYFTSILFMQDYIKCLQKLKKINKACHRIYENEKDEMENIEYNIELLQIFHKKTINMENILGLCVLENIPVITCLYYIQKL